MRAILHHARIAPKKANLIAAMVRRQNVPEALHLLEHFPKKAARLLHEVISSALANAEHNAGQERTHLYIKSLTVQKGPSFKRSIPMARGRSRPIDKWTSHITVELGVTVPVGTAPAPVKEPKKKKEKKEEKAEKSEVKEATVEHVTAPPIAEASRAKRLGEDPHGKGFSPKHGGPSGPTFQPHHRGGRGS